MGFPHWLMGLGERAIILLFAVVYHDRHSRSLVVVVIEEHGIGADPLIFRFYAAYAQYKAAGTVIGFRVSLTSLSVGELFFRRLW